MEWSAKQEAALAAVSKWHRGGVNDQQVFRLFGYAGSGKTTLAKHFAQGAGTVMFAAFTGKAASVLRDKGCPNAGTIHSLIYQPRDDGTYRYDDVKRQLSELEDEIHMEIHAEDKEATKDTIEKIIDANPNVQRLREELAREKGMKRRPMFELKAESDLRKADLLIVDEVSMVDEDIAHDLMSFGVKILALGDPAQLPPVKGTGYFTDARPDILLDEVHRQARDNPIIDIATRIRSGEGIQLGSYGESRIISRADASKEMYLAHDQMLVGKNATRKACNREFRRLLGRDATPIAVAGDRLICLRNDRDKGLLNGTLWNCLKASESFDHRIAVTIRPDGAPAEMPGIETVIHDHFFLGEEPAFYEMKEADCFDFGYAITTHKAQGSQWDKVLILDESFCFREDARKWLYTAVTRAAKSVTIVK